MYLCSTTEHQSPEDAKYKQDPKYQHRKETYCSFSSPVTGDVCLLSCILLLCLILVCLPVQNVSHQFWRGYIVCVY